LSACPFFQMNLEQLVIGAGISKKGMFTWAAKNATLAPFWYVENCDLIHIATEGHLTDSRFCAMMAANLSGRGLVAVRLPIDDSSRCARSGANVPEDGWARPSWLQYYFSFTYFPYAAAVGRCPAHGRFDSS